MSKYFCSKCENELSYEKDISKVDKNISGTIVEGVFAIDYISRKAENKDLYGEGYYYFAEKDFEKILTGSSLGGKVRNFCSECLCETLDTKNPHYGDGVYLTFNSNLRSAPHEVKRAHGISVANRINRLRIYIKLKPEFIKIDNTGGVFRSQLNHFHKTGTTILIHDSEEISFRGFEIFDNGKWIPREKGVIN